MFETTSSGLTSIRVVSAWSGSLCWGSTFMSGPVTIVCGVLYEPAEWVTVLVKVTGSQHFSWRNTNTTHRHRQMDITGLGVKSSYSMSCRCNIMSFTTRIIGGYCDVNVIHVKCVRVGFLCDMELGQSVPFRSNSVFRNLRVIYSYICIYIYISRCLSVIYVYTYVYTYMTYMTYTIHV